MARIQGRSWRKRLAAAGMAAFITLMMAGCSSRSDGSSPPSASPESMDAIAAQIQATLAKRPDIVKVEVLYSNDLSNAGAASATIRVKAGAVLAAIEDAAVQLIWQSRLKPLYAISIDVIDEADNQRGDVRHVDPDGKDQAELEGRYGPRPN